MKLSSGFAVPSAVAILSAVLLCSASGTAMSQPTTGSDSALPAVSVEAPKQMAKPTVASPRRSTTATTHRTTGSSAAQTSVFAPNTALGRLARLEKSASTCNGGCETSYRVGNAPWVGCSISGDRDISNFSPTCRDTLTYNTYAQCVDTKTFLGSTSREARWICSSLLAGGKLAGENQVAEIKGRR
jgi:hypothetical protein